MNRALDINWNNIESTLSEHETVFIDIWDPDNNTSNDFQPVFNKVSMEHKDLAFVRLNIQEQPDLTIALGVGDAPLLMVVKKRIDILQKSERIEEQTLQDLIEVVREIDVDEIVLRACRDED